MIQKATWLHLRIPFSLFLLPVYLFALSISEPVNAQNALLVFIILHFFLYPASNGYNSYFDKDEESIGGLKNPPKTSRELYYTSLVLDLIAVALGLLIGWTFAIMLVIYGLVSKAYSHPAIRLKRLAFTGWFTAGLFQGWFTFIMIYMGISDLDLSMISHDDKVLFAGILSTLLLWGSYPMTQIYQHQEDARRGDNTLSLVLGITGTFHFTAIVFFIADLFFICFYVYYYALFYALIFQLLILPMLIYFFLWYIKVRKNRAAANFDATMRLNMISALCLNVFFLLTYLIKSCFI